MFACFHVQRQAASSTPCSLRQQATQMTQFSFALWVVLIWSGYGPLCLRFIKSLSFQVTPLGLHLSGA
jgi:hypothetical protein